LDFSSTTWRLIRSAPGSGAWNMAVDEAILMAIGADDVLPTLRLYAWNPPCLSLGYAQKHSEVDWAAIQECGWDVVRRPTGGRAILHTDELTYSVIGPADEPRLAGGVLESYSRLAKGLSRGLIKMGMEVAAHEKYPLPPGSGPAGPVCFEIPSNYEITLGGKKLIGSAQARRKEGVLQHGSLPLYGDLSRITQALVFPTPEERLLAGTRLLSRATTVESGLGRQVSWEEAAECITQGFSEALSLYLVEEPLSPTEIKNARRLMTEKYAHPDWTRRV